MKCLHCKNARVVMKKPAKSSQLTKSDVWRCLDCKRKFTGDEIKEILEKIITVFQQIGIYVYVFIYVCIHNFIYYISILIIIWIIC